MKPWTWIALAVLTLAGLGVRLAGLDHLLPHRVEIDGQLVYQAHMLEGDTRQLEKFQGTYGLFMAYLANLLPRDEPLAPAAASLEEHRRRAGADVLRMRLVSALLSVLIVPGTFFLARRVVGDGPALFAAALAGFDLMHVSLSQQARPHAPAAALGALAMLACLRLRRAPGAWSYALAALAVGLTLGTLQNGLALLLPLGVAWLLLERGPRWPIVPALAAIGLIGWACYPVVPITVDPATDKVVQSAHFVGAWEWNGKGFAKLAFALRSYLPVTSLLALLGLAWALARPRLERTAGPPLARRDLLVVLSFAVPYLLVIGVFERFQDRFFLPLLPYAAILAALFAQRLHGVLARGVAGPAGRLALGVAGALALLAFPVYVTLHLVALRSRPDTLMQATTWMERNLRPGDRVLVMLAIDPPVFQDDAALAANGEIATEKHILPRMTHWFRYQREVQRAHAGELPHPRWNLLWFTPGNVRLGEGSVALADDPQPADYAVIERYPPGRDHPVASALERNVRARGELVARFSCFRDGRADQMPFECEGLPGHPYVNVTPTLLACSSVGPVVEIYRCERAEPPPPPAAGG